MKRSSDRPPTFNIGPLAKVTAAMLAGVPLTLGVTLWKPGNTTSPQTLAENPLHVTATSAPSAGSEPAPTHEEPESHTGTRDETPSWSEVARLADDQAALAGVKSFIAAFNDGYRDQDPLPIAELSIDSCRSCSNLLQDLPAQMKGHAAPTAADAQANHSFKVVAIDLLVKPSVLPNQTTRHVSGTLSTETSSVKPQSDSPGLTFDLEIHKSGGRWLVADWKTFKPK